MSLIDGVNKFWLVYHTQGAMHFDGCKSFIDVVERAVMNAVGLLNRADFDVVIADARARIDRIVAARDKDDANDAKIKARRVFAFDGEPTRSNCCPGCGEKIQYRDLVWKHEEEDVLVHEGCDLDE